MDAAAGERGEAGTPREGNTETYITKCETDIQWGFAAWPMELKLGLGNNLEGGMGREMGGMF